MEDTIAQKAYFREQINALKKEKNAVVLAHYYQEPEIQDVADYVGDSLGLSQQAASTSADIIVFAGVHFMAETAKILNPNKKVLLPDLNAGCSLSDSCQADDFRKFLRLYPDHVVISYINCSAEIKALSDVICTSSNALEIVNSVPDNKGVVFAPDRNLGSYVAKKTGRPLVLWNGACQVHEAFSLAKLLKLCNEHPHAKVLAHPESDALILEQADFIGSTAAMVAYAQNTDHQEYIVATEAGILHQMKKTLPERTFIPAPALENNSCACSECPYMKMNTLEKLYRCLLDECPEIQVAEKLRERALLPITRMLNLSGKPNRMHYGNN